MKLAKNLTLPHDAPARTIAVFGQKGSGKTYLGMVLTESMLTAGVQVVCLDPTGVWWGLKAEGTGPGFPILVMGGDHGDVPLAHTSGTIVADFVVSSGQSVVLDLSAFTSNAEQDRFVSDFAERLYRAMNSQRTPLHVVMDEADSFAPQNPRRGGLEPRMLGAIETIVRRGRSRGLGMTMITQRPAVLNKNVVEQADLIISTRIVGKNDHAALRDMTKLRATREEMENFLSTIPALPNGFAFFWSPEWLSAFHVHEILKKRTFDSSRTPEPGEKRKAPKLAKVDLAKLSAEIQATVDAAKKNDPNALRLENQKLAQALKKTEDQLTCALAEVHRLRNAPPAEVPKEVPVFSQEERAALDKITTILQGGFSRANQASIIVRPVTKPSCLDPREPQVMRVPVRPPATPKPSTNGSAPADLPKGERSLLIAAAQYPDGLTREHAALLVHIKRSTRDRYIQYLQAKGYLTPGGGTILITQTGIEALGDDYKPLPTGSDLRHYWLNTLPEGESKILRILFDAYPSTVSREAIDEATGLARSTRDRYLQYLAARKLIQMSRGEGVTASPLLFER